MTTNIRFMDLGIFHFGTLDLGVWGFTDVGFPDLETKNKKRKTSRGGKLQVTENEKRIALGGYKLQKTSEFARRVQS